jgi:hypothetical protein
MTATNIKTFAATHETSIEVARAIFDLAVEGCEESLWCSPDSVEEEAVIALAWSYAKPDVDTLHWGNSTIRRDQSNG